MFESVFWYRNVSKEGQGDWVGLLGHKRKIVRLTVDLAHMYLVCTEMLQEWKPLHYKLWTPQQTIVAENPTDLRLKNNTKFRTV